MVLVNWNTEWAAVRSARADVIRERLFAFKPEIVCLTEAFLDFLPEPGHVIAAEADYGYPLKSGRRKVLLWSRRPWGNVVERSPGAMPPGRYVYGETGTSLATVGVHGVCIPWADAHVRTGGRNRERWQDHLAYLSALPDALDRQACELQIMTGDFNQRIPRKRVPVPVFEALQHALEGRFTILTAGIISPIEKQTIDHVAAAGGLKADWIQSISNVAPDGRKLSDHFGIAAGL